MPSPNTKPAVLIVGAGPSGLVLGLSLAQNGVPFRIIEKDATFHAGQRGAGMQPRSLEVFRFLGLSSEVLNTAVPIPPRIVYKLPGGTESETSFHMMGPPVDPTPAIPYPNCLMIGQTHYEEFMRNHLARFNVKVELGTELVDFEQDDSGVRAHVVRRGPDGDATETITVDWIVSAEGGRSVIRKQLGLNFRSEAGSGSELCYVITDIYIQGIDQDHWHSWGDKPDEIVHLRPTEYPGLFSVMLSVSRQDVDVDRLMKDREALTECIRQRTNRQDLVFGDILFQTKWMSNTRMVNQFSSGRAFLIGDAAHIHTPAGAQGANTGMQDGFNLGWKLAIVYKGLASPSLVETYNEERLPVARAVLDRTTAFVKVAFKAKSTATAPLAFKQLGVNYRWSSIVVDEQGASSTGEEMAAYLPEDDTELRAGDRAPDASGLKSLVKDNQGVTLFSIFKPTYHTFLIFKSAVGELQAVSSALTALPKGTFRVIVVVPVPSNYTSIESAKSAFAGADDVLVDTEGNAYSAYHPIQAGYNVIVVRPDGVIGAVVKGAEGVKRYLKVVFSPLV